MPRLPAAGWDYTDYPFHFDVFYKKSVKSVAIESDPYLSE